MSAAAGRVDGVTTNPEEAPKPQPSETDDLLLDSSGHGAADADIAADAESAQPARAPQPAAEPKQPEALAPMPESDGGSSKHASQHVPAVNGAATQQQQQQQQQQPLPQQLPPSPDPAPPGRQLLVSRACVVCDAVHEEQVA